MIFVYSDPVDSLIPREYVVNAEAFPGFRHWVSPAGNFCFGLTFMGEDGRNQFTVLGYRSMEKFQ